MTNDTDVAVLWLVQTLKKREKASSGALERLKSKCVHVIRRRANDVGERRQILKLLDREGLQFFDFNMAVFRKRDHHRGDAFTAFLVCFVYA